MKNHKAGWAKAIAETNARISANGQESALATPEPESKGESDAVIEMRKRCAAITGACADPGMAGHAIAYFDDTRALDEILDEIRAVHLSVDFAAHQGLASEFKPKAH